MGMEGQQGGNTREVIPLESYRGFSYSSTAVVSARTWSLVLWTLVLSAFAIPVVTSTITFVFSAYILK